MARLAAAHRALTELYNAGAEDTVDWLLTEAIKLALMSSRCFAYVDPLGGAWIMIELWKPELLGGQQWAFLVE